jgi:hypothetical protein
MTDKPSNGRAKRSSAPPKVGFQIPGERGNLTSG